MIGFVAYNSTLACGNKRLCQIFTRSLMAKFEICRFLRIHVYSIVRIVCNELYPVDSP